MNTMRERRLAKAAVKKAKAKELVIFRQKIRPISKFLQIKSHIKPRAHAKLSNIRSYLTKNKLASKKQRSEITEENVLQKWSTFVGPIEEENDSETETEYESDN